MTPALRKQWIEAWLRDGVPGHDVVDVLDSDFVCAYADATQAPVTFMHVGAPRCKQLGRDLAAMYADGLLERCATGLPAGDASMSFPKWVYTYSLTSAKIHN